MQTRQLCTMVSSPPWPMRPQASKKEVAFQASKKEIVKQCELGIRSFNPSLPTCLAMDWSKFGISYWLCQKRCFCPAPA